MTTSTTPAPRSKRPPPVQSPAEEARYHRGMIWFLIERGYTALAESHAIAAMEAEERILAL